MPATVARCDDGGGVADQPATMRRDQGVGAEQPRARHAVAEIGEPVESKDFTIVLDCVKLSGEFAAAHETRKGLATVGCKLIHVGCAKVRR